MALRLDQETHPAPAALRVTQNRYARVYYDDRKDTPDNLAAALGTLLENSAGIEQAHRANKTVMQEPPTTHW